MPDSPASAGGLSASELAELRDELERQLLKLTKSMRVTDVALETVVLDQGSVGRLSRMDSLQNQGIAQNLRERETARLGMIRAALLRLDDGTYGRCTGCGKQIAFGRLFVVPEAAGCGACI